MNGAHFITGQARYGVETIDSRDRSLQRNRFFIECISLMGLGTINKNRRVYVDKIIRTF